MATTLERQVPESVPESVQVNVQVRAAQPADLPAVLALGREFHADSNYADLAFDGEAGMLFLERFQADQRNALFLVATRDEEVVGFFVAVLAPIVFSRRLVANQQLLYVRPDARNGLFGKEFFREYIAWAKARDVLFADFAETAGIEGEALGRFAARLGFERIGSIYRMHVAGGA